MKHAFEQALANAESRGLPLKGVVGKVYRALRNSRRDKGRRRTRG